MSQSMRYKRPHTRCGICDEEFEVGADTVYVDDERCHRSCAENECLMPDEEEW